MSRKEYHRLRPRWLLLQLVVLIAAETSLFISYREHESSFHWATHFLVGFGAAALWDLTWLLIKRTPAPGQLLSILAFHLLAMFPDFMFSAGVAHYPWMDVFLAHNSSHFIPGGIITWLVVSQMLSALYALALTLWLQDRQRRGNRLSSARPPSRRSLPS